LTNAQSVQCSPDVENKNSSSERRHIGDGLLVIPVLAMILGFSALALHWGLAPAIAVAMPVALSAATFRMLRRTMAPTAGQDRGWIIKMLRIAAALDSCDDRIDRTDQPAEPEEAQRVG
jgi:hypothetical protein